MKLRDMTVKNIITLLWSLNPVALGRESILVTRELMEHLENQKKIKKVEPKKFRPKSKPLIPGSRIMEMKKWDKEVRQKDSKRSQSKGLFSMFCCCRKRPELDKVKPTNNRI